MPSSSSAKKVARVAAKSGTNQGSKKAWMFWAAIAALVVGGIGLVFLARDRNGGGTGNATPPRANLNDGSPSDHWHAAFAISICGEEQPPLKDAGEDIKGIHTHGDGLVHIHPFVTSAAGNRATMAKFFDQTGLVVTDDGFKTPDGKVYKAGETKCEGKDTELVMAHWKVASTAAKNKPDKIIEGDFDKVRFTENYGAYTLALVPKGDRDIPAPSSAADIEQLGAADGGTSSGQAPQSPDATVGVTAPPSTAASDSTKSTATTAPKKP